jgi:hypothetical protein
VKSVSSQERPAAPCRTCRGRGWLNVRSRPVYVPGALRLAVDEMPREQCWDCGGHGTTQAEGRAALCRQHTARRGLDHEHWP